ncbi:MULTISPECIES: efflux RND transporter permease subunit [Acetobacter]|uniref:Nodulation protein NolG n=1 Tax=Acetobacter pomorum DM001 TaxID=945681 RepID=F1YRD7_9PROT|nr:MULTISPECIES: efflux RND transporter permease subunit [Acetobacter]ATI11119.1 AcrB/AcrD/AcrF family protein [Acetobacter pomorum]AXC26540.1 AcrB/AcrD/AcrF family protein [Acetobacter sp. JWB]EGE48622.1 Nodulation protein NolG [Acetobacter pomorum DM001]KAA8423279.1 efflux RND transporter permease subunit [Acetobacter pomorum]KAA8435691.1 efflux RND transporter permease subunit [Acetobacter pomorum]
MMSQKFNPSRWAVEHPQLIGFLMIISVIAGGWQFINLGRAEDPNFTLKSMTISAQWAGASPDALQAQIINPLEQELRGIDFLDTLSTYCNQSFCVTQVSLNDNAPKEQVPQIWQKVRNKVADVSPTLPEGGTLSVNDDFADVYGYTFALTGPEVSSLSPIAKKIKTGFQRIPDVAKVQIIGEIPATFNIDIDPVRLKNVGMGLAQFSETIQQHSLIASGGMLDFGIDMPIDVSSAVYNQESIEQITLPSKSGNLHVKDIATVSRGYIDPPSSIVRYHGKPALIIAVAMAKDGDGLTLGKKLNTELGKINSELPTGLKFVQVEDQSKVIKEAVNTFLLKFFFALLVVLVVAFGTLGFRSGMVVAFSVPLTLSFVALYMKISGIGLERISLGALILSLGLLVDDAIISIEAMIVQLSNGASREDAASYAWEHTAFPMLTGTLITIISFLPVGIAKSTTGEYAGEIFWVSAAALLCSWVVAVIFIPLLGVWFLPQPQNTLENTPSLETKSILALRKILEWVVVRKKTVCAVTLTLLVMAILGTSLVNQQFFPLSDRPELIVDVALPPGSSLSKTNKIVSDIESKILYLPSLAHIETHIGDGAPRFYLPYIPASPSASHATLLLVAKDLNAREELFKSIKNFANGIPASLHVQRLSLGPTADFPVQYRIIGSNIDKIINISHEIRDILKNTSGTSDVQIDWGNRTLSESFQLDAEKAAHFGSNRIAIAQQMQAFLSGEEVGKIFNADNHRSLVIRAEEKFRHNPQLWGLLPIQTQMGNVFLGQLGSLEIKQIFPVIWRRNGEPCITVQSDVMPGIEPLEIVEQIKQKIDNIKKHLPYGYRVEVGGDAELSQTANDAIFALLPPTIGIMLLVLMLQLQKFSRVLLVLCSSFLGLIGAVLALLIFKAPFGFVALLGLIALAGMIMRNTILLVDQIEYNKHNGLTLNASVIDATILRARPVILTALASVFAFIPLAFNIFWGPMAIVMIGGLSVATFLTLLSLPAFYLVIFSDKQKDKAAQ